MFVGTPVMSDTITEKLCTGNFLFEKALKHKKSPLYIEISGSPGGPAPII